MTDIPYPMISQGSAEDTLNQIIVYLNTLVDAINHMFENIDITNLNESLANRINSSLTEHQDMSAFATSANFKKEFGSFSDNINSIFAEFKLQLKNDLEKYKEELDKSAISEEELNAVSGRIGSLQQDIRDIESDIRSLNSDVRTLKSYH